MNRTAVVYFDDPRILGYPLNRTMYYQSYQWFSEFCQERGIDIIICRGDSYQGDMTFREGYRYAGELLEKIDTPIKADLIYLKGEFGTPTNIGSTDLVINPPEFNQIAGDKWATYQRISEFMPLTLQITEKNWREVIAQIPSEKIVLKPEVGNSGRGIFFVDKANF